MRRARVNRPHQCSYVTKGGLKLEFALAEFHVPTQGVSAVDLGCHRGGFTDCLLSHGAERVHSVDTGYGILDWKLRTDPRVIVYERTNLLHWKPPEQVDLVVVDAGWTPQRASVPAAIRCLKPTGCLLSLVKPQYEIPSAHLLKGVVPPELLQEALRDVRQRLSGIAVIEAEATSPYPGSGGNVEVWLRLSVPRRDHKA